MLAHVPRPEDAEAMAALLTPDPLFGAASGLFLAGPRRMGKSTFLLNDLAPKLRLEGRMVLYVDLWADRTTDPGNLITACVAGGLREHASMLDRLRGSSPISGLGVRVELRANQAWEGTVSDALATLSRACGKDIVLIVDEAQHSLSSTSGMDAMFALKAARDAVNLSPELGQLYLVMTGSHRDKLAALVTGNKAPFLGAQVRPFPELGAEYVAAVTTLVNGRLDVSAQISESAVSDAFDAVRREPEALMAILSEAFLAPVMSDDAVRSAARRRAERVRAADREMIESLPRIQRDVLAQLVVQGDRFTPFSAETLAAIGSGAKRSSVQKALDALRDKGLVWRPSHGLYVLERPELAELFSKGSKT